MSEIASSLAEALALHQAGRLADAERIYTRILAGHPGHFDCLHLLGVMAHQRGRHDEAVRQIDLALRQIPDNVLALNNRGIALYALKRFAEALASYDRALAVQPDHVELLCNRGLALYELGRFEEALASHDRALALRPDYPEALLNRGNALKELKRFDAALESYQRALALRSNYAEALLNRGNVLREQKRPDAALEDYDRALTLRPDLAEALSNRGAALYELDRFEEAVESCDRALALRPQFAEAHANRANALHALKRFDEALASSDRAVALRPDFAALHYNRGNALHRLGRFREALASYDRELMLRPDYAEAHANRGVTLQELRRFDEALASYQAAYRAHPDFADARYNEALCRLLVGDLRRGWEAHEGRWKTDQLRHGKRNFPKPLWTGSEEISGKTVLLHAEQGFGDTIQFCRYAPLVAGRGARVILEVQRPLRDLMKGLPGAAQVLAKGDLLPDFDTHCPLLSLPRAFATDLATIPSATPYLRAPPPLAAAWSRRLGSGHRRLVGLAWSGRPTHKNDHNRSMALAALLPGLAGCEATFVSLQRELRPQDAETLRSRSGILHFGDALTDFSDTAGLIANLDLVVSVDTGVAHLAGALGKPVWVLLPFIPDWRWLLDREDSPWYPTARLFRQDESRRWESVMARLNAALRDWTDDS